IGFGPGRAPRGLAREPDPGGPRGTTETGRRRGRNPLDELDGRQSQFDDSVVARHPNPNPPTDGIAVKQPLEVADALDRPAVEVEDEVAGPHARGRRWTTLEQLHDLERLASAKLPGKPRRQGPRATHDAKERPPNAAVTHQRTQDPPRRRVDRDRETKADARDRRVDPDDATARIGQPAAGVAGIERRVGLDDVLDEAARPPIARPQRASQRADDAGRDRSGEPQRVADRDDEL